MKLTAGTLAVVVGVAENANMQSIVKGLEAYKYADSLDRPEILTHYLCQNAHESGGFHYDREIVNPNHLTKAQSGYEGRKDLGNTHKGDGIKYVGRTGIQVTGRANTAAFRDWCTAEGMTPPDFEATPDAMNTDPWEGIAPIWYWHTRHLTEFAKRNDIEMITKRINGGLNGYEDRIRYYTKFALSFLGFSISTIQQEISSVKAFQSKSGIPADGDAGPKTRQALHDALSKLPAFEGGKTTPSTVTVKPTPTAATFGQLSVTQQVAMPLKQAPSLLSTDVQNPQLADVMKVSGGVGGLLSTPVLIPTVITSTGATGCVAPSLPSPAPEPFLSAPMPRPRFTIENGLVLKDNIRVEFKKSPNKSGLIKPEILTVHDTASGLNIDGPVSWLTDPAAKASAHFVVGRDGKIIQLGLTNERLWHAGKSSYYGRRDVNGFSVGIEIVNTGALDAHANGKTAGRGNMQFDIKEFNLQQVDDDNHPTGKYWMPYTDAQIDAVIGIGRALVEEYGISDVVAHWFIAPLRKQDTNPLFPMELVKNAILHSNRGPVQAPRAAVVPVADLALNALIKDEVNPFDAVTTTDVNLRPWPDSPNRYGVIITGAPLDIVKQTRSQNNGDVWVFVRARKDSVKPAVDDKGVLSAAGADGFFTGFVHASYLKMVN
jgi:putative chitinase